MKPVERLLEVYLSEHIVGCGTVVRDVSCTENKKNNYKIVFYCEVATLSSYLSMFSDYPDY